MGHFSNAVVAAALVYIIREVQKNRGKRSTKERTELAREVIVLEGETLKKTIERINKAVNVVIKDILHLDIRDFKTFGEIDDSTTLQRYRTEDIEVMATVGWDYGTDCRVLHFSYVGDCVRSL